MSQRTTVADAVARADSAHQKIDAHEDLCAVRYEQIERSNQQMKEAVGELKILIKDSAIERKTDIKGIYDFLWKVALGAGGAMFAIIILLVRELLTKGG